MGDRRTYIIHQIVKYSLKLDQKGFGANHDGNITAKLDEVFLATPTAVSKGNMTPEMVITLDRAGKKIEGIGNVFSEIKLHLAAYLARDDAKAIVHAHPPFATARGLSGFALYPKLPEAIISIGAIVPVVAFAMPGTNESETIVREALLEADVLLLPGNGVIAIGDSVEQAYLRLELVEHLAKIDFLTRSMGSVSEVTLSNEQIQALLDKRAAIGLGPKVDKKTVPYIAPKEQIKPDNISLLPKDMIKQLIAEEIKKALAFIE